LGGGDEDTAKQSYTNHTAIHHGFQHLFKNDFALAIQTPIKADVLKQFSSNGVICVDSTYGTNGYDFNIITVMVIDEYGEGYPVAWCMSNKEDHYLLQYFYEAIKNKTGVLHLSGFRYNNLEHRRISKVSQPPIMLSLPALALLLMASLSSTPMQGAFCPKWMSPGALLQLYNLI